MSNRRLYFIVLQNKEAIYIFSCINGSGLTLKKQVKLFKTHLLLLLTPGEIMSFGVSPVNYSDSDSQQSVVDYYWEALFGAARK